MAAATFRTFALKMRRMITVYAILISVFTAFALLSLSALLVSLPDHWKYSNSDSASLHAWTTNAPIVTRTSLIVPGLLIVAALLSLKLNSISDRLLLHGICITSLLLSAIAFFVVSAGLIPAIVTITEMQ